MKVGVITGSGFYDFKELKAGKKEEFNSKYGMAEYCRGTHAGHEVIFVARHGSKHKFLPNMIPHQANIAALKKLGADAVISASVMGVLDPNLELGRLMLFDDLFYPDNRLPDGTICTMFDEPGGAGRGHYIFGKPFSGKLSALAKKSADTATLPYHAGLVHAHSFGPRFNTQSEIRFFVSNDCSTVSQTVGPEVVLSGEMELPVLLLGFGVDYANGVKPEPTPIETLNSNMRQAKHVFSKVILGIIETLAEGENYFDNGMIYRFG